MSWTPDCISKVKLSNLKRPRTYYTIDKWYTVVDAMEFLEYEITFDRGKGAELLCETVTAGD